MSTIKTLVLDNTYFHLGQITNPDNSDLLISRRPNFNELVTHANLYLLGNGLSPQKNFLVRGLSFLALLPVGIISLFILPFTGIHINLTYSMQSLLYLGGEKIGGIVESGSEQINQTLGQPELTTGPTFFAIASQVKGNQQEAQKVLRELTDGLKSSKKETVTGALQKIQSTPDINAYLKSNINTRPVNASEIVRAQKSGMRELLSKLKDNETIDDILGRELKKGS